MLFNSYQFLIFLPVVLSIYWMLTRWLRVQNGFLLIASYVFYGWWDWRFLSLIAASSAIDFLAGIAIQQSSNQSRKRFFLGISLTTNLGLLGVFKYYNFFAESLAFAMAQMGVTLTPTSLQLILPVGISFYTFQTLSYTIDVYRAKITATRNAVDFFAYVSFFPQLVAGPIERASELLPQFQIRRCFCPVVATAGLRQILWGLFKKMVVADNCAAVADAVFNNPTTFSSGTLAIGVLCFAFQIYGDFSGYSDIAIGVAKLFGFRLSTNFRAPYFSRDIAEFWRRWHISLTTWFRDYVYIPLGGSRGGLFNTIRNTMIVFLVSGLWHGANMTYLIWGGINALLFLPLLITGNHRKHLNVVAADGFLPSFAELLRMALTFLLVNVSWVFFRAASVDEAFHFFARMAAAELTPIGFLRDLAVIVPAVFVLLSVEWITRKMPYPFDVSTFPSHVRHTAYTLVILLIFGFGRYNSQSFIYFQF